MHEAAPVRAAIASVVDGWEPGRTSGHLDIVIADPTRAHADGVDFYAAAILADRGLPGVTFEVRVLEVRCVLCDEWVVPAPHDPTCPACGAPLPGGEGPAIVCRESETVPA